jgi:hypothetical protein
MPMAMANLFEKEVHQLRRRDPEYADPSCSACIVLVAFALWYGTARRIPQSVGQSAKQLARWEVLCSSLEDLYPLKDWSSTKKFHNAGHHVHTLGFAIGSWELASTNVYEVMNKFMKAEAAQHTNRKAYAKQVSLENLM